MKNKKIIVLTLSLAMAMSVTACGTNSSATSDSASSGTSSSAVVSSGSSSSVVSTVSSNADGSVVAQLTDMLAQGYTIGTTSYSDGVLSVNLVNADHTDFQRAECTLTDEENDKFFDLDMLADDFQQQCLDFLSTLPDLTLKNMNDSLPDPSEYESYVGQTVEDMEDDGFDYAGASDDEDGKLVLEFYVDPDDGDTYTIHVYPEGEPEDDGSYDDESILDLVVGKITFWEFN